MKMTACQPVIVSRPGTRRVPAIEHRDRGVALALVLIALAIAVVLSLTFLSASTTSTAMANNLRSLHQARAVAESGMALTLAFLEQGDDWRAEANEGPWMTDQAAAGGTFDVLLYDGFDEDGDGTIDSDGDLNDDTTDPVTVIVVGRFGGVSHRIEARVYPGKPKGGHLVLMVGAMPLSDQDKMRKAIAERWGWHVVPLLDIDSSDAYEAALDRADVVWISEEALSYNINLALTDRSVGIVNEEQALYDELLIAASGASYQGSEITVTDTSHYLTTHLTLGRNALFTRSTELIRCASGLADGARVLGTIAGGTTPALVVVESGALLTDGSSAAGRRVVLPWGGNNCDFALLNDDGQELLRKALIWASPSAEVPRPTAHYRFEEASGVRAADSAGSADGTYTQSPTLNEPGISGRAVTLDDTADRVTVPAEVIQGKNDYTFCAWIKTDRTGSQALLSGAVAGNDNAQLIFLSNSRTLRYYHGTNTGSYKQWSISSIADDRWHHLAIVRDATRGEVTAYLDGVTKGTQPQSMNAVNVEHLVLGEEQDSVNGGYASNQAFVGMLDEAMFFDEALAEDQIAAIFASYDPDQELPQRIALYDFIAPDPVAPNLVARWKLDEPAHQPIMGGSSQIRIRNNARVRAYDTSQDTSANPPPVRVVTYQTGANSILLSNDAQVVGSAYAGPGGNAATDVVVSGRAVLTGTAGTLRNGHMISIPQPPPMSQTPHDIVVDGTDATISYDFKGRTITIRNNSTLTFTGHRSLWATNRITIESGSRLVIASGSSLKIYAQNRIDVKTGARLHGNFYVPDLLTVSVLDGGFYMSDNSVISGTVYAKGDIQLKGSSILFGNALSDGSVLVEGSSQMFIDQHTNPLPVTFADEDIGTSHGYYRNGATAAVTGRGSEGTAAAFDGNDDFVEIPHDDAFLLDNGSLGFWFRADDLDSFQVLASKDSQGYDEGGHLTVGLYGNRVVYWLEDKQGNDHLLVASGTVNANTWYHCAVTFGEGGQHLYLNGELKATSDYTGGLGASSGGTGNTEPWTFGVGQRDSYPNGSSDHWSFPYHGRIDDIRLYDQNFTAEQAMDLYGESEPRAVVPPLVEDTSNYGSPLDLRIVSPADAQWVGGGGLEITGDNTLASDGPATKLHDALTESNAYTVELRFTPATDNLAGPAELIAYGNGSSARQFAIGQEDREIIARMRTSSTLNNGSPDLESGDLLTRGETVHLLVAFDGEQHKARIYKDGRQVLSVERLGDLSNWSDTLRLLMANDETGGNPWRGTFYQAAIWDRAFNLNQAKNVYAGKAPGDGTGAFRAIWYENP